MWGHDKVLQLIQFYSEHEFLWNPKHPDYKNKPLRKAANSEIAGSLECESSDVVLKWVSLKGQFIKEVKKVEDSNGEYTPKWYAFEALSFLNNPNPLPEPEVNCPPNIGNYCRSCMRDDQEMYDAFSTEIGHGSPVSEVLFTLTGIVIRETDEFPTKICENCKNSLDEFLKFKEKAAAVQDNLRNLLEVVKLKQEQEELKFEQEQEQDQKKKKSKKAKHGCIYCEKSFNDKTYLEKHLNIHENLRSFLCDLCGKGFNNEPTMKAHRLIHTGEKPFGCKVCGKQFRQASTLTVHMSLHNGKKVKCPDCGKCFSQKMDMERHRRVHTGERPFGCDECGKRYTMKAGLVEHIRVAHRGFRYACKICAKEYANRSRLTVHMRFHTNEKPYKCNLCPEAYHRRDMLDRHINKCHFGTNYPKIEPEPAAEMTNNSEILT